MRSPGRELQELLDDAIPSDHARQTLAETFIERKLGAAPTPSPARPWRVLDLGCGTGDSVDFFRARDPDVDWTGVDIADSREAHERTRSDARFEVFDGVSLPFGDGAFDLVYCKQVLEHVHRPAALLSEVARVLAPAGRFAGSTSQLEPFHSRSTFGYTPFGFASVLADAGLALLEIRPGIDSAALIARRAVGNGPFVQRTWGRWWGSRSPLNRAIDGYGRLTGMDAQAVNANKLLFCGQFAFVAARAGSAAPVT
jgi:SAM-dependent methyltransferase